MIHYFLFFSQCSCSNFYPSSIPPHPPPFFYFFEDQSLCIYEGYYKLAQGGSSHTECFTVPFLSLNVLVLISILRVFFPLFFSYLEVPFLLYTPQLVASWPFIYHLPDSLLDTCPLKLQVKVVEATA